MSSVGAEERCAAALNAALVEALETRDDVVLFGEDVIDPYGGAFKITKGLSTRWPDRVLTTPISESSLFGVAAGLAMRGRRPVLEIMFGDFVALGLDQTVNGIGKFREMFDDQVRLPLVVRTPMGGRRGYGPTHSQSLEKLLLGIPGISVVAPSECHDLRALLLAAIDDDDPVFFIENKLMYGRPNRRPAGGRLDELHCEETGSPYPTLSFSGNAFSGGTATIVTYGGMLPIALEAAVHLIVEDEIFVEVVALGRLLPLDLEPVLESVARTGSLVTLEEGTLTAGVGAEIAARVQSEAWGVLRDPVRRVAADDRPLPAARTLEEAALPGVEDVVAAVRAFETGGG
jgi:2-oxoisovalerate dehydrogenase E1 component